MFKINDFDTIEKKTIGLLKKERKEKESYTFRHVTLQCLEQCTAPV